MVGEILHIVCVCETTGLLVNWTHLVSFLVLLMIGRGLVLRRERLRHVRWMLSAFLLDTALVLWIELNRSAIEQAFDPALRGILAIHIGFSAVAALGWLGLVVLGGLLLRGHSGLRAWHLRLAVLFLVARLGNFLTSFLIV